MKIKKVFLAGFTIVLLVVVGSNIFRFIARNYRFCGDYSFVDPPCDRLPKISKIERAIENNKEEINKLKKISSNIFVATKEVCQGKGLIIISHPSESECADLRKILVGDRFLGFPFKIINQ